MASSSASTYTTFARILSSYHEQYPDPSSSSSAASTSQLDAPVQRDAVLDEEGGMLSALMGSLEETFVLRSDFSC